MLSIQNVSQEAKKAALKEVIEQEAFQANRSNTTIFGSHVQLYGDQQWNAAIEAAAEKCKETNVSKQRPNETAEGYAIRFSQTLAETILSLAKVKGVEIL